MSAAVAVRHNFETAHRLPHIGGKCFNLHGHSWWTEITVAAPALNADGLVVEFGAFKRGVREWIDTHLDHGAMLGTGDPLLAVLRAEGSKVFEFEDAWPTVEATAELLASVASGILARVPHADGARVLRVDLQETAVNKASWTGERA
jgi:6-pyruvoyltetrahydropterin/6-carboxytetrahydropterin synthase